MSLSDSKQRAINQVTELKTMPFSFGYNGIGIKTLKRVLMVYDYVHDNISIIKIPQHKSNTKIIKIYGGVSYI